MEFGQAIRKCMIEKYYPLIEGRAARSEFWWFMLFYLLISVGISLVIMTVVGMIVVPISMMGGESPDALAAALIVPFLMMIPAMLLMYFLIPPIVGVTIRRLHDRNMSGWWYLWFSLLMMIPLVNFVVFIWMLVLLVLRGTSGPNRFGPDPLAPQGTGIFE